MAQLLNDGGVRYALIGGYAIAAHGYNRFSEDLDILVDPAPENTRNWIAALSALPDGACAELIGQDDLFQREGEPHLSGPTKVGSQVKRTSMLGLSPAWTALHAAGQSAIC